MSDSSSPIPISKQRLSETRRLGVTPRSPELTAGVVLLAAAWVAQVCLPQLGLSLQELATSGFRVGLPSPQSATSEFGPACLRTAQDVFRIWGACWASALLTDLAQIGFVWSPVTILPHEERVSPISGVARLLSWQTLERSSLLSIKLACGMCIVAFISEFALRGASVPAESSERLSQGMTWTSTLLAGAGGACLLSGILDAWIRQRRWRVSIEQTEEERRQPQ